MTAPGRSFRFLALGALLLVGAAFLPFALPFLAGAGDSDAAIVAAPVDRIQRGALSEAPVLPVLAPAPRPSACCAVSMGPVGLLASGAPPPASVPVASLTSRLL